MHTALPRDMRRGGGLDFKQRIAAAKNWSCIFAHHHFGTRFVLTTFKGRCLFVLSPRVPSIVLLTFRIPHSTDDPQSSVFSFLGTSSRPLPGFLLFVPQCTASGTVKRLVWFGFVQLRADMPVSVKHNDDATA